MEKLLNLLNEWYLERYGTNPHFVRFDDYLGNDYWFFHSLNNENLMIETEVWTKKYWFIKWLVENDKIETNHLSLQAFKNIFSGGWFVKVSDLEVLLMLLSISDTPIEDLISYLK